MKGTHLLSLFFLMLLSGYSFGQEYVLSGYITDADNGESLIGASVYIQENGQGTVSNEYGFYSLTLEKGSYSVIASYLGYQEQTVMIELSQNVKQDFELKLEGEQLDEIVVTAEAEDRNVRDVQMSVNKLDIRTIQKIPSLLGEQDVIKSIQLLPGVTTVGEGAAGFNVRGGSIDQNLVILDEAPVYNSSHLFGFFSVFNPDAVKDVKLYKGGIPARYGGRLSSILDVRMKDGNNKSYEVNGGVGTIFSRLSVEGPIQKNKSSFILAGRRSYIDVLAKPFLNDDLSNSALNFYDLTLKTNYKVNESNQLFLSGYFGRDNFVFGENAGFNWGNKTLSARWNHLFSDKLFSNFTAYYSNYDYKINFGDTQEDTFDWNAKIINYSVKPEFSYFIHPDNILRFGGQSIFYEFQPANALAITDNEVSDLGQKEKYAIESSVFAENELDLKGIKMNYGLRLSHFAYLGGRNVYTFDESTPVGIPKELINVEFVEKGKVVEDYINLEPRASLQLDLNGKSSLKASYNRTVQYIHLLSNTTASTPVDVWTPSTNNIVPQNANQVALGYFRNIKDDTYEASLEVYYKKINHLIDYVDGADLILNDLVEGEILEGDGRAYGAEWLFKKVKGDFTGWISYTIARSERQVKGVNNNEWYPSRFDKTHDLSITGIYDISDRVSLSGSFVLATGTPTTLPNARYTQQGILVPHNSGNQRNNFRIPAYHRLDVSVTLNPKKSNKRWKGQWVFGVYNVYNRRNAFNIFTAQQDERVIPGDVVNSDAYRLSVVGSFVPAISYNFTFK